MYRKFIFIFLTLFCSNSGVVCSQTYSRRLDEGWEFLKSDLGGVWEAVRPAEKGSPQSVPAWAKVALPHCFNAEDAVDPEINYYQGPGWYRTRLKIDHPLGSERTLLHFEGAGQKTEVFVYTTKVGSHIGGYDEWTIDITEAIKNFAASDLYQSSYDGTIPISIRCDNSRDLEMIPSSLSDFNVYGGLYRYVNLVQVPALSIQQVQASSVVRGDGQVELSVTTKFYNKEETTQSLLSISLIDNKGVEIKKYVQLIDPSNDHTWNVVIEDAMLWSPRQPILYTLEVTVRSGDRVHVQKELIGFRQFEFKDHGPFILNGKRLFLRGTHRHEDHAGVGSAMTAEMVRREMILMKEMGVNFIRLGHYQQSRVVLDLCDSLGILVWEEIPWCRGGLGGEIYKSQARRMLTNMISQHYNHPSVIIWGLGNENDWPGDFAVFDESEIQNFMRELNILAHNLDPSRKTAIRRCEFCKDIVDVYSPSIWSGWYRGRYTEYKEESIKESEKVRHFLHVEWGGDSHAMRHSEYPEERLSLIETGTGADEQGGDAALYGGPMRFAKDGDWSETYICNLMDWYLKEQESMPWLTGSAFWVFKDFSTPLRPLNPVPYVNQKGVVQRDLTKKESYYVFQSYWTQPPMVHIYGHNWPIRWGPSEGLKSVKVYSNCDEVELFVNEVSYGIKRRNSEDFPAAGLRWQVHMREGTYHFRAVALKGNTTVEDDLTQYYQTTRWSQPAKIFIQKVSEEKDVVVVEASLRDANNTLCLDAGNWIMFSLAGDGKLIDNMGTSTGSRKVQAYNGRATIQIKLNGGSNVVAAKSPGLPTALFHLNQKRDNP